MSTQASKNGLSADPHYRCDESCYARGREKGAQCRHFSGTYSLGTTWDGPLSREHSVKLYEEESQVPKM